MQCPDCRQLRHSGPCVTLLPEDWDPYEGLEQAPDDLEMLTIEAERAQERLQDAIRKQNEQKAPHEHR